MRGAPQALYVTPVTLGKNFFRFLDVFGGMEMARSVVCDKNSFVNPNGIGSFSPGLARFPEGLPWVPALNPHNPARVEYQGLTKQIQPLQGCDFHLC